MLLQPCDEGLKTLVAIESAAAAAPAMAVDLTLWRFLEPVSVAYWHGAWLASAGGTQIATQLQTQAGTAAAKWSASVLLPPSFFTALRPTPLTAHGLIRTKNTAEIHRNLVW